MKAFKSPLPMSFLFLSIFVSTVCGQPAAPARKSLIENGGFEDDPHGHPPAGWRIWGGPGADIKENFFLDSKDPQEGKYSWRIRHPRGTHAFPVSNPKKPIETKKAMTYLISFWARTANTRVPGVFYLEAFKRLRPYEDVSSPLRRPIEPSTTWRRYSFQIDEGVDFFADEARYLLLAFRPTQGDSFEQTLWIDGVAVSEVPSTGESLFDPRLLKHEPLNHRLKPGEDLRIVVDATKCVGPSTRQAGGVSFHRIAGWGRHPYDKDGNPVLEPELIRAVAEMRLPMTRFYGVGDHRFSVEEAIDKIAHVCRSCRISQQWVVLELEPHTADRRFDPASWAAAVKYSVERGYAFRFWEVCNEPYTRKATAFEDPAEYARHVHAVSEAVRAVQHDAQIGIGIYTSSQPWGTYVLKEAAGAYDFVVGHYYASTNPYTNDLQQVTLAANYKMLNHVLRVNATIAHFNPNSQVYQLDTEWGLSGAAKPGDETPKRYWRNANIVGTLHRAVRMIYYAREGMLRGASGWEMFARPHQVTFAFLTRDHPNKRFMLYWLYYYFNRHCANLALDVTGTAPWLESVETPEASGPVTPALVTLSESGHELYIIIANGSWEKDYPCTVALANFQTADATGRYLSQADRDADPLVDNEADVVKELPIDMTAAKVSFTVPAHSIVFVRLRRTSSTE
jgi:hypothetical protein